MQTTTDTPPANTGLATTHGFKFARLPENYTDADIHAEIARLKHMKTDLANEDSSLKVILNSIYGVAGYLGFILYDRDVAQSITAQCVHLTKYTIATVNRFFSEVYHEDTALHAALGIAKPPAYPYPVVNYADTDSMFFVFGPIRRHSGHTGDPVDFLLTVYDMSLKRYITEALTAYLVAHNCFLQKPDGSPAVDLDLEEICRAVLWCAAKKYIKDPIYSKKKRLKSLEKLTVKGLELNQAATPRFIRGKLQEFVRMVMESDGRPSVPKMLTWLSAIKREFHTVSPEDISRIERAGNYEKLVLNDKTMLEFAANCKPHVKGAGYYNFLLNQSQFRWKYDTIKSGDKVHYYYTKSGSGAVVESFAFLNGQFPGEFAPPIDHDVQFEKVLLGPINNILRAMNMPTFTASLSALPSLW